MASNVELAGIGSISGMMIGMGRMRGYGSEFKFGYNAAVGTTEETIWANGGRYSYPSAASIMTVSSSDANDTAAGSGARTVQIYGLDENWLEADEIVTLDGQTPVNTVNQYIRAFRAIVRSAGGTDETAGNAGDIYVGTGTVTAGVPANIYIRITPGDNQTLQCSWTVPAGKVAYLIRFAASSFGNASAAAVIRGRIREFGEVFRGGAEFTVTRGVVDFSLLVPIQYAEKTDIEITGQADSGTIDIAAWYEVMTMDRSS